MAKRILITGAFGQLGEAVVQELQPHFELTATGRRIPTQYPHYCTIKKLDITERERVRSLVSEVEPNVIVHLAAYTDVDGCEKEKEKAWRINVRGTEHIADAVRERNVKIIHVSSDYVFDGTDGPYNESAPPNPVNYYGRTKLAAENVIRGNSKSWIILRTNVLYGNSSESRANFVNWVVTSLESGRRIQVVDDQWGNPTWTGGLAEAIKMAIVLDVRGIFNYGGAEFLTRFEFARKIADVFDQDGSLISSVSTDALNQLAARPLRSGLLTDKIEEILGLRTYRVGYCLRKVREGIIV